MREENQLRGVMMPMIRKAIIVALGVCALLQGILFGTSVGFAQTETTLPFSTVGFQSGVIDEVQGSTIRIDGRSYAVKPGVQVVDHQGRPLELDQIVPTSEVKFHLKEGQIDKMAVKSPQ